MLIALLAGCRLEVDVATTVAPDGSGTVVVTVRADEELVAAAPGLVPDLRLDDLTTAGWVVDGPYESPSGGIDLVVSKAFATPEQATAVLAEVGVPLQATVAQAREFALVRTTVQGTVEGVGLESFADAELVQALGGVPLSDRVTPEQVAEGFDLTVRFALPGEVVAANGVVEGSTVSWDPPMEAGAATALDATSEVRDDEAVAARDRESWARQGLWIWAGLVGLLALVALGVLVWRLVRR